MPKPSSARLDVQHRDGPPGPLKGESAWVRVEAGHSVAYTAAGEPEWRSASDGSGSHVLGHAVACAMLAQEVDDVGMVQRLRTLEWCLILVIRHIDIGYTM